jgi:hypothetical protein
MSENKNGDVCAPMDVRGGAATVEEEPKARKLRIMSGLHLALLGMACGVGEQADVTRALLEADARKSGNYPRTPAPSMIEEVEKRAAGPLFGIPKIDLTPMSKRATRRARRSRRR